MDLSLTYVHSSQFLFARKQPDVIGRPAQFIISIKARWHKKGAQIKL